ncbi:unnamed protein product [Phyllotreta striolata]|uniref:Uncharacterized protein n=1 Tax=Phyllotreta striolata TaxID=444603 RepID=A0A9P0DRX6_PHYSR|nr:unnamed protein product [Phyllotreta striolata]
MNFPPPAIIFDGCQKENLIKHIIRPSLLHLQTSIGSSMRYAIFFSIVLFIIWCNLAKGFINVRIIREYFKEKMVNFASIVGCFNDDEKFSLVKSLGFGDQKISILNVKDPQNPHYLTTQHHHIGVVVDGDCSRSDLGNFLKLSGENRLFDVKHHWLILSGEANFSETFNNVELYINADISVMFPWNSTELIIQDVYNPASTRGGRLKKRIMGYYNRTDGYNIVEKEFKYTLRRDMSGVTLRSIIVLPIDFNETLEDYLNNDSDPHINTFNRFHYSLLRPCVAYYNFTSNVTMEKSWGYLINDTSFDGLVGALERKLVDYGSSPLFVRADRGTVMEYGRRTWTLKAAFIFRNPKSLGSADIFLKPLSTSIWVTLICTSGFMVLILRYTQILEKTRIDRTSDTTWSYLLIGATSVFCQQGLGINTPSVYSGRITVLVLLILSYLVFQFYSASVVSNLLIKPKALIQSIESLLKSPMQAGCEDILYNRDYFKYTTDQISKQLYEKKILKGDNNSNFLVPEKGLEKVRDGGYAFHVELATAYPIIKDTFPETYVCELNELQMYRTQPMHANFQKHSPYRDMFDTCIQRLAEYGIIYREIKFWHPKKPECVHSKAKLNYHIGIDNFYPVLCLLAIGMIISLLVLSVEMYLNFKAVKNTVVFPFTN